MGRQSGRHDSQEVASGGRWRQVMAGGGGWRVGGRWRQVKAGWRQVVAGGDSRGLQGVEEERGQQRVAGDGRQGGTGWLGAA